MSHALSQQYAAEAAIWAAESKRSLAALVGVAIGLLGDRHLNDQEIQFLRDWLVANDALTYTWPGDVVLSRVRAVLEDGVITETERAHLVDTLTKLVGGGLDQSASATMGVTELLEFDQVATIEFSGAAFCLTGDFVYAPREVCERAILSRGGLVKAGVSKALRYLVVGGLGSAAWKHGSFGTKIDKAMQLKREGAALLVVDEPHWTAAIERCPVKPLQSNP